MGVSYEELHFILVLNIQFCVELLWPYYCEAPLLFQYHTEFRPKFT